VGLKSFIFGYISICLLIGLYISVVFQLAHIVEKTTNPKEYTAKGNSEWLIHQFETTANFAPKSRLCRWLFGGLTHQVEHHIDHTIAHIHLFGLSEKIREKCKEYGVKYNEYKTFLDAVWSHTKRMWQLGKNPNWA
jgi:linoleoyl-CoA desaturase